MTSYGDVRKIIEDVFMIAKTVKTVYKAEEELKELTKETEILSNMADDVQKSGSNFESNKDFQSALEETNDLIADLKQHLEKRKKTIDKFLEKLKWPTRKSDFKQDLDKARRLTNLLSQMNMTLSIRHISDIKQDELVDDFIKRWTPPMAAELLGAYPRVQVTEGTGQWILNNGQYRNWEQSGNGVLWINGLQGCGKTGLAITIDDRLRARQQQRHGPNSLATQVAAVFCYHQIDGMRNLQDHMEILMSLWVQLVKSKPECRQDIAWIKNSKDDHDPAILTGQRRLKVQRELLQHALKHSGNTVLILDGLDEVPRNLQRNVIQDLRSLQRENGYCRILITSRPYDSIARIFKNDPQVYMEAPDVDLTLYMEERFSRQDWDYHCEFRSRDIIEILLEKCQKSFILTQLIMDEVERADSKAHCERIISELPSTVDEAYRRGINRLKAESSSDGLVDGLPCMSIQALFWVAFAPSSMTGDHLEHALAIADSSPNSISKVRMWRERGIDSQTGKLVVVDPAHGTLIIAHKTLTSYLTKSETRLEFFPTIHEHIHVVQLKCLLADHCKSEVLAETEAEYLQQYPLLPYALRNWGDELARVLEPDTLLWRSTEAFLGTSFHEWNKFVKHHIIQVLIMKSTPFLRPSHVTRQQIMDVGSIDGLYWAVIFDLQGLVPVWIDVDTECLVKDPIPTTPLGLAAVLKNVPMVKLLIKHGAQVNITQRTNILVKPPLYDAVFAGSVSAAELLLQNGADMTSRRGFDDVSPLDLAYESYGYRKSELLISYFPGLNGTSAQVLQFLVKSSYVKELRDAIRGGMDINHPCENGKRALDYALEMEHGEIIKLLRHNGAISNLHWPAEKTKLCPYPMNLREPIATPLVSIEKEYDQEALISHGKEQRDLILEIPIHNNCPIRSIVFETITAHEGKDENIKSRRNTEKIHGSGEFARFSSSQTAYKHMELV
ncbi:hypothetical protein FPSE_07519 [Fusarium pseudograminearum CS3096]|uniref:Nephrocystin 3-like N-terminal domain-containing protein n=1 Tax=Fusarium pseudograminearum (strain CS3096) TaxID=1028729 RepID=K3VZF1_FUSPC|nr:hypothetical protein FPSE_07519 [Fusarium pseudograminearum CS3096]EKJ72290.1 hypothetical protein FPSE_07519 [Fusarium pseudograminearum CS3096]